MKLCQNDKIITLYYRFYSTYKELKQVSVGAIYEIKVWVFTLPIRNWNTCAYGQELFYANVFTLPIRNWNFPIKLLLHLIHSVFTLPIRNWNYSSFRHFIQVIVVFTLPIRNWNAKKKKREALERAGFYSTYKELKLLI